jgi:hypothetical protein
VTRRNAAAYADPAYRRARRQLTRHPAACIYCGRPATTLDHVPALALHHHERNSGCCELHPACLACNVRRGVKVRTRIGRARAAARRAAGEPNASRQW